MRVVLFLPRLLARPRSRRASSRQGVLEGRSWFPNIAPVGRTHRWRGNPSRLHCAHLGNVMKKSTNRGLAGYPPVADEQAAAARSRGGRNLLR